MQRDNLNLLNAKIQAMRDNQASSDALLVNVNQKWNQVTYMHLFLHALSISILIFWSYLIYVFLPIMPR